MLMCSFVEKVLAVLLDLPLMLFVDLGRIINATRLEIGISELLGNLSKSVGWPDVPLRMKSAKLPLWQNASDHPSVALFCICS